MCDDEMNPYLQLSRTAGVFSVPAKLIRPNGVEIRLKVKPQTRQTEGMSSSVPAALQVREWTCMTADLTDDSGVVLYPVQGTTLVTTDDSGIERSYDCTRDSVSGRYWEEEYLRAGYRVKFWTKFNPLESKNG